MTRDRVEAVAHQIVEAGLPTPIEIRFAKHGGSIAVAFRINGVTHTVEGFGTSDATAADDVIAQFRRRLGKDAVGAASAILRQRRTTAAAPSSSS